MGAIPEHCQVWYPNPLLKKRKTKCSCCVGQLILLLSSSGKGLFPLQVGIKPDSLGSSQCLSEGALSPDGTVLATASHDGFVKFWQIYIEGQDEPR